jgi:hypothetical protein
MVSEQNEFFSDKIETRFAGLYRQDEYKRA